MPPVLDTLESSLAAAQRLAEARQAVEHGERGLQQLRQSRAAFIQSLRATGLSYAQACIKFDNCLQEQLRLQQAALDRLQYAERRYGQLPSHPLADS
jgi:hypothetical protein